jgi:SAM-dependent methyltransferase
MPHSAPHKDLNAVTGRLLSSTQAERFYDKFGKKLDSQAFYEAPALKDLAAHLDLGTCRAVVEFGCGTGRFAEELFESYFSHQTIYVGRDISSEMVRLARERLARYGPRTRVEKSMAALEWTARTAPSTDLFAHSSWTSSPTASRKRSSGRRGACWPPAGLAGLVSLTNGKTPVSRLIATMWNCLRAISPMLVGGCRPIEILRLVPPPDWTIEYESVLTPFGVPCEVAVARKAGAP